MKVLVTGARGQAGTALMEKTPRFAQAIPLSHADLDVTDESAVRRALAEYAPDWIINAAAYTAVDAAESDAAACLSLNATAVAILARAASDQGARLLHLSTDFVFDGRASRPYAPEAATAPLNVYGSTKLQGEHLAREFAPASIVLRTSWLYSRTGSNFVKTMLRLMSSRTELGVVCDQVGSPTFASGLADAAWRLIEVDAAAGVHHWSDCGVASWYDFAVAIGEEARQRGLLASIPSILPIRSDQYPCAAKRPSFSLLDCQRTRAAVGLPATHWRVNLRNLLDDMATN